MWRLAVNRTWWAFLLDLWSSIAHFPALVPLPFVDALAMDPDTSSTKRVAEVLPQASYHIPKRSRLDLPEEQLKQLNATNECQGGKKDIGLPVYRPTQMMMMNWYYFLRNSDCTVSAALQTTILKDRIVTPEALPNAAALRKQDCYKEKAEWMKLLKKALDTQDWEEWIRHRACDRLFVTF